jgi:hypothetical protein
VRQRTGATRLSDDHVGGYGGDARDRADQVPEPAKGLDHLLDPPGELADRGGVLAGQVQVHPGQEPMMLAEPALKCLGQLGDPGPQPPPGQARQHVRVTLPSDQRLEHRPPRDAQDVRGDR